MSSYRGEIVLCGKRHVVEVIDGVRLVDGLPVEDFIASLSNEERLHLFQVGSSLSTGVSPSALLAAMESDILN